MNYIGGFFELETKARSHYHAKAIRLNTARNCLEYLIKSRKYKKIFLPFYHCDALREPLKKLHIEIEFYSIDEHMDPIFCHKMKYHEAFLYINYFGLKGNTSRTLAGIIGSQLIIDNAQAFFEQPIENIDTFYSPRKFLGVPDGAYLYTEVKLDEFLPSDVSYDRMTHLVKRLDCRSPEDAYQDFLVNEKNLSSQPIRTMSKLTSRLLASIDYEHIKKIRKENYSFFVDNLGSKNKFDFGSSSEYPMAYPFMSDRLDLREKFLANKIFVASYWPNVLTDCSTDSLEYDFAARIIPLPIDQRYRPSELSRIMRIINEN